MDVKHLHDIEIKDEAKGEFTAVIATYGVKDSDGDVTLPGAHKDGQQVVVSPYGHSSMHGQLPVGAATLKVERTRTLAKGHYFMEIPEARSAFLTMKRLHDQGLGEWSYGYSVLDSEMGTHDGEPVRFLKSQDVFEVSHVLRGAGVGTRTLTAKSSDHREPHVPGSHPSEYRSAIRPHSSAITAREWDTAAVLAGVAKDASVSDLRTMFAWVDPAGDPEAKASYRFAHHHGVDGPANVRALIAGIAALNGAGAGPQIPEADRKAVYDHLAAHLRDADREPPELRPAGGRLTLHEEALKALAGVAEYLDAAERVAALRAEKGKALSQVNLEALDWVGEDLRRALVKHADLVRRLRDTPREAAAIELARYLANQRRSA
jgi:hypothetical protein